MTQLIEDVPDAPRHEYYDEESSRLKPTQAIVVHGEQLKQLSAETLHEIVTNYNEVSEGRASERGRSSSRGRRRRKSYKSWRPTRRLAASSPSQEMA